MTIDLDKLEVIAKAAQERSNWNRRKPKTVADQHIAAFSPDVVLKLLRVAKAVQLTEQERSELAEFVTECDADMNAIGDAPIAQPGAMRAIRKLLAALDEP